MLEEASRVACRVEIDMDVELWGQEGEFWGKIGIEINKGTQEQKTNVIVI